MHGLSSSVLLFSAIPLSAPQIGAPLGATNMPLRVLSMHAALIGQNAGSSAGRPGERQTSDQAKGIEPLARINGRIANRVQSRIHTRIDRTYNPQPDASSPFVTASKAAAQTPRVAGRGLQ